MNANPPAGTRVVYTPPTGAVPGTPHPATVERVIDPTTGRAVLDVDAPAGVVARYDPDGKPGTWRWPRAGEIAANA